MGFYESDRNAVLKMLETVTKALDKCGEVKRDLRIMIRANPHWPPGVLSAMETYKDHFEAVLFGADAIEAEVITALNEALPPFEEKS